MMTVKDFLIYLPGPEALVGAVVFQPEHGWRLGKRFTTRLTEKEARNAANYKSYLVVERPPLYPTGTERYCKWCKEPLIKGYSPRHGLEDGYCPTHGRAAPVLHAPLKFANVKVGIKEGDRLVEFKPTMELRLPFPHKPKSDCVLCTMGIPKKPSKPEFQPITGFWPKAPEEIDEDTKRFRDNLFNALKIPKALLEGTPPSGNEQATRAMEQRFKDRYGIR
jgi:hypothetical protein